MNLALTPTQLEAHARRVNFRASIARKAAELKAAKLPAPVAPIIIPPSPTVAASADLQNVETVSEIVAFPIIPETPVAPVAPRDPTIAEIQQIVVGYYGVTADDLKSARRTDRVVLPRQVAIYLSRHMTRFSLPAIAKHFGDRDHTTIYHAIGKVGSLCRADADIAHDIASLFELLTGEPQ